MNALGGTVVSQDALKAEQSEGVVASRLARLPAARLRCVCACTYIYIHIEVYM